MNFQESMATFRETARDLGLGRDLDPEDLEEMRRLALPPPVQ